MNADARTIAAGWIGREQRSEDQITPELAKRLGATLDWPASNSPDPLLGVHWCLALAAEPMAAIGVDGHPARGGFLPPIPLPRRMWAGGELTFLAPLRVGDTVRRTSTIKNIVWKEGRSGPLAIVTVCHDYDTAKGPALRERQDIVYRTLSDGPEPAPQNNDPAPEAQWSIAVPVDPVLLFRYSALTFNAHRIHYDRRYCLEEECYPGLVVHGPLQASLLLRFAGMLRSESPLRKFSFRSTAPIFDGGEMTLNADGTEDGLRLWTADQTGNPAMSAWAQW